MALGAFLAACGDDDSTDDADGAEDGTTAEEMSTTAPASDSDDSGTTTAPSSTSASSTDAPADDAEPVVIEHRFGETEIDNVPERIVSLDVQWTDVLLAMGVEPVAAIGDFYGTDDGRLDWQMDAISADVMLDGSNGLPMEAIAAAEPDLIVGSWPIEDNQQYELLSEIAPTIASLDADREVDTWQSLTTAAGTFLRNDEAAAAVIARVDALLDETRQELPGLEGKTFALSQYVVGDAVYVVADPEDGSSVLFEDLGMTMAPSVLELADGSAARPSLSPEQIEVLDADFLAFLVNGGDESNLTDLPGWDMLPSVQDDAAALLDYDSVVGLNTPSPLSIPYSLEAMRPALEAAAD